MNDAPSSTHVRWLVARAFRELGTPLAQLAQMDETLHVDRGRCVARSYSAGPLMAMWLRSAEIVQFYGPEGEMLRTLDLRAEACESQQPPQQRRAA